MPLTDKTTVSGTDYYKYQDPAIWTFDSIAAMRAFMGPRQNPANGLGLAFAWVASWSGDTLTADMWAWNNNSTTADDGVTVVKPTDIDDADAGRWIYAGCLSNRLQ